MRDFVWTRFFGFIGLLIAGVLVVIGGLLYWAATHPGAAWTHLVQPRIFSKDTQVKSDSASFKIKKISWRHFRIDWNIVGLKIDRAHPPLHINANLKVVGNLRIASPTTELHIENFEVLAESGPTIFAPSSSERAEPKSPYETAQEIREQLLRFNNFVRIDRLKVAVSDLQLPVKAPAEQNHWQISVIKPSPTEPNATQILVKGTGTATNVDLVAMVRLDQVTTGGNFVAGHFTFTGKNWGAKATVELAAPEEQIIALIKGGANYEASKGGLDIEVSMNPTQLSLKGRTDLEQLPGPVPEIKDMAWKLDVPLANGQWFGSQPGHVTASGPIALAFVKPELRQQVEMQCKCKWPEKIKADIDGSLWPLHLFDDSEVDLPVVNVKVRVDSIQNAMMDLNMAGQFTLISDRTGKLQYWPVIETSLKLHNFQHIKALLEANKILVPAPFDVLAGTINLTSKATLAPNEKGTITVPAEVKVALASSSQKVNMVVNLSAAMIQGQKAVDLYANFNIEDFIVELPPMDPVHGLPKIVADSRLINRPAPPEDDNFKVRFIYDVRTTKPGAIRLLSKLARPAVPISVDVDRTKAGDTRGIVKAEPFELNYMHRALFVDGLRLILDDRETADFAVDGRLRMEQTQYKVSIIVSGTIRSPLIKLTSEPELSRSDIISVILYDRTTDQLVAADRETAGVFDTAVADRAVGLLGLWVFASTPIRSFHYNPATKVYTATVQLAEGTSASLGTDWEEAAQVEVRKRVTKRWVLTASWKPGTEEKSQSGKLVLQWEKRF